MNISPRISVIVPVYNAERYLHRCIDSILAQTFTDFELLLIDDGSKDKSEEICEEYSRIDHHIRVYHKENGGVNSARKFGFDKSFGDYIVFVDSDDELPVDSLSLMYQASLDYEFDILVTAKSLVYPDGKYELYNKVEGIISKEDYVIYLLGGGIFIGPHGRMTRRDLFINSDAFEMPAEIVINEDLIMNLKLGVIANRIYVANNIDSYMYYQNPCTASKHIKDLTYWSSVFNTIESVLKNNDLYRNTKIMKAFYAMVLNRMRQSTGRPKNIKNSYLSIILKKSTFDLKMLKDYLLLRYNFINSLLKHIRSFRVISE